MSILFPSLPKIISIYRHVLNLSLIWAITQPPKGVLVFQTLGHVWLFETPWTAACQASLSFTISWSLLKLISFESVMPFNHLILCHLLPLLPSIFPSIRVFSNKLAVCIRWPKDWSFSFSISPSNECSGLISFRIDWFDFLLSKGLLKKKMASFPN